MNKKIMIIWGFVVFAMCTLIYIIGYNKQDREYIDLSNQLKEAGKQYIKDNRISTSIGGSVIVYIDELINGQYIEKDEKIDEYCIEGVIYSNEILIDKYNIKKNCKSKKAE